MYKSINQQINTSTTQLTSNSLKKQLSSLIILIIVVIFSSCVSNKQVQYLQHDDVNADEVVLDSVVRTYQQANYEYKIQSYDLLSIKFESLTQKEFDFFNREQLQGTQANSEMGTFINGELVDESGAIEFPVVGKIILAGMTLGQAEDTLQVVANQFLKEAAVKVRLLNFRFTILGEVNKQGTITSYNNRVSILEAIGLAGGIGELADRSKIKIIRSIEGSIKVFYINLLEEKVSNSRYYYIHQNDVIIIPPLKQRPFRKYAAQNAGLILSSISTLLLIINLLTK